MSAPAQEGRELFGWDCEQIGNWALHALTLYIDNDHRALFRVLRHAEHMQGEAYSRERQAASWQGYMRARIAVAANVIPTYDSRADVFQQMLDMLRDLLDFVDWHTFADHYAAKLEGSR